MEGSFSRWKDARLSKLDQSRKGRVDARAREVVSLLNGRKQFFTTSSCSGRIVVIDRDPDGAGVQKKGCVWLMVTHEPCGSEQLVSALSGSSGDAVLKMEAFVLHVQCERLQDAQLLHSVAVSSGFRNSGLTVSRTGKILVAVRGTLGLEVPLGRRGELLVEQSYLNFLLEAANQKMEENFRRIDRFFQNLQRALSAEPCGPDGAEERPARGYQRRRRSGRRAEEEEHRSSPELDGCEGLFT